jgi:DNA-binding transcriptional regulator LsrR (DeoR family)
MTGKNALETREPDRFLQMQLQAAWLYYIKDLTQQEIATRLGISRVKVTRLIQQARSSGLVSISINNPTKMYFELQDQLIRKHHLKDAIITVPSEDAENLMQVLANGAANYLAAQLKPGIVIGVGVGRTVALIPQFFQPDKEVDCTFIELSGGPSAFFMTNSQADVIYAFAKKAGGNAVHLKAPFFVENAEARKILLRNPIIKQNLDMAHQCDLAIFSVGVIDTDSMLVQHGIVSRSEMTALVAKGALGDVLTHLFDKNGIEVRSSLSDRLIGLNIEDLSRIPLRILVAGGKEKYASIHAALTGRWVDVLITDQTTAGWLVSHEEETGIDDG